MNDAILPRIPTGDWRSECNIPRSGSYLHYPQTVDSRIYCNTYNKVQRNIYVANDTRWRNTVTRRDERITHYFRACREYKSSLRHKSAGALSVERLYYTSLQINWERYCELEFSVWKRGFAFSLSLARHRKLNWLPKAAGIKRGRTTEWQHGQVWMLCRTGSMLYVIVQFDMIVGFHFVCWGNNSTNNRTSEINAKNYYMCLITSIHARYQGFRFWLRKHCVLRFSYQ